MSLLWPVNWSEEIQQKLLAPFPDEMIEVREGKFFYVDARAVQSRLDEVVGPANWSFDYSVLHAEQGGVGIKGCLTVLGVTKCDAGEHWRASDRDKIEVFKAAVSDALKRAAVHFGVGRYLYELEVARAGKMTQAERDAAARKAGYTGDPEVHDLPCSVCGADVDIDLARKCQRTYGGRVFCVRHKAELDEGVKAQTPASFCCECGDEVTDPRVPPISLQKFGAVYCVPCGKAKAMQEKARIPAGTIAG